MFARRAAIVSSLGKDEAAAPIGDTPKDIAGCEPPAPTPGIPANAAGDVVATAGGALLWREVGVLLASAGFAAEALNRFEDCNGLAAGARLLSAPPPKAANGLGAGAAAAGVDAAPPPNAANGLGAAAAAGGAPPPKAANGLAAAGAPEPADDFLRTLRIFRFCRVLSSAF